MRWLLLVAVCGCDGDLAVAVDAAAVDAHVVDAAPSKFGRCNASTPRAEITNGRLIDAAAAGALIAAPDLALWPADGGASIALPGVPETAVLSGTALYWRGTGDVVVEHALAGAERTIPVGTGGLPATIVRGDGAVYVVTTTAPARIERIAPGGSAELVATSASPISNLAVGGGLLVWQEGADIRTASTTLLTDASARLLGLHDDTFVVQSAGAFAFYRLADGGLARTIAWDAPIASAVLGPHAIYIAMDRRETMIGEQWCSIQPTVARLALSDGTSMPLVTEPERVIAAPDQAYVQTAGEHGHTCCSGHGMFSCNEQSIEPTAVWCFAD